MEKLADHGGGMNVEGHTANGKSEEEKMTGGAVVDLQLCDGVYSLEMTGGSLAVHLSALFLAFSAASSAECLAFCPVS